MESSSEPIQIQLTEEQQELISRLSGQLAQVLELTPEPADPAGGVGHGLQFRWRLSTGTGIPSQPVADPPAGG
jgi:hypothetical protein